MGMILRIASSRIVGQGDIVGRSGYFSLNLSANSVMRGRLDARRTLKSLVADLRYRTSSFGYRKALSKGYMRTEKTCGPVLPLLFRMGAKGGPVRLCWIWCKMGWIKNSAVVCQKGQSRIPSWVISAFIRFSAVRNLLAIVLLLR